MNYYIAIFISGCVLIGLAIFKPLSSTESESIEIAFLIDKTDTFQSPNLKGIKETFQLKKDKWKAVSCSFLPLTNLSLNEEYKAILEPENKWLSNELTRNAKVANFSIAFDKALSDISALPVGKERSSLYLPLARKLNILAESEAWTIELHMVSDLMEHTDQLSFYDPKLLALMQSNPDTVIKQLNSICPLQSLRHITIHFYFIPQTEDQDKQFEVVSQFYKTMLQRKGAAVFIN